VFRTSRDGEGEGGFARGSGSEVGLGGWEMGLSLRRRWGETGKGERQVTCCGWFGD
jgi:hypothetical protein